MIRTIKISDYISIQGVQVAQLEDGKIAVRLDGKEYFGFPVSIKEHRKLVQR
jgi:hypothetical protein